jgi:hypothetical protein
MDPDLGVECFRDGVETMINKYPGQAAAAKRYLLRVGRSTLQRLAARGYSALFHGSC